MTKTKADPFNSISDADLAAVNGGRVIPNKGPDAVIIQGIQTLVKTLEEAGKVMSASSQAQSQQTMQMMQQLMERRKAGGAPPAK